jgi:NAD(P)-dependent dehydrogenase (short-subunit alcohol dehydrogenase family)
MMKKSAVITGSSGLIGTELCREFLSQGYTVYAVDKKPNPELKHDDLIFLKADISKESDIRRVTSSVKSLDVLINNAARTDLTFKPFSKITLKNWNDGLSVNITSFFLFSKLLMPKLKQSKGSIINISSTRHLMSEENTEIYSASKGAIVSLTHAMAVTQRHFVRVNSISPGWIADPGEKLKKEDHAQHLVGRVGRPSDISKIALFLASDDAAFITGQDFIVDGGMTKKMIYS